MEEKKERERERERVYVQVDRSFLVVRYGVVRPGLERV